jgi:uncharacterized membrane protein
MNDQASINQFTAEDIEKNKVMAALAYIIFFLPLIASPDSPFGKYHANQGLLLFITGFVGSIVLGMIPVIGWLMFPFFALLIFAFAVIGFVNAINGKAKELPIIGKYSLIK